MKSLIFIVAVLCASAAQACDTNAVVLGLNSYGAQAVVVPSYGVQALNVGYGFGRQAVVVGGHRQAVIVNRGRQAIVVNNHRPQVIVQNRSLFGGGLFNRQRVVIVH